jgi:glucose/mannose-6-phosphate isomerase
MREYLLHLDRQIDEAIEMGRRLLLPRSYRRVRQILFYGMGGSAISGDILRVLVTERSRDFFAVERGGHWPPWAGPETLTVFSSYSGNTVEILQHLKNAQARRSPMVVVTSGGRLGRMASEKQIPCLRIPSGIPPRCAIGYLTFSVLPVLEQVGRFHVTEREVRETASVVRGIPERHAKKLARRIFGKATHLYGAAGLMEPVLIRWRCQLAENAKTLASHHVLPEMFHNEIEGWRFPHPVIRRSLAVFLLDRGDSLSFRRKRKFVEQHIRRRGGKVLEIRSRGKTPLARIFSLISLADWVSYELALLNGVDPDKIPIIEAVKRIG